MTAPNFRLLPWERGSHEVAPFIELGATVEGRGRRFAAKVREGVVYFRFADEDDERIWTLLAPAPEGGLEAFFAAEVEANRVARYFVVERGFSTRTVTKDFEDELKSRFHPSNMLLFGPTALAVRVDAEGHGLAQEWCGGSWIEFSLPARTLRNGARRPSIWHRGWNARNLRGTLARLAGALAFRPFVPPSSPHDAPRFLCGSEDELNALLCWACLYFVPLAGYNYSSYRSGSTLHYRAHVRAQTQESEASISQYFDIVPLEFANLFVAHHLPVGGNWSTVNYSLNLEFEEDEEGNSSAPVHEPKLRADFHFGPNTVSVVCEVPREPSAHERMEAFLTLREWLETHGYGDRVQRLLSS